VQGSHDEPNEFELDTSLTAGMNQKSHIRNAYEHNPNRFTRG
jgi:hypothetical protein